MEIEEFIRQRQEIKGKSTENEILLRKAIRAGTVTPEMSLREIGKVAGIGDSPNLVRHYLEKFGGEQQ